MGAYLNPGNSGFTKIRNSLYVDKTGLIGMVNRTIDTAQKLTCISRPRRFGKSFAAQMLCAYYDRSCDSAALFDDLEIAQSGEYRKYLNQYDVIYLDMTNIISEAGRGDCSVHQEESDAGTGACLSGSEGGFGILYLHIGECGRIDW